MSLKKNVFYQVSYQIIILVIPLILSKYVTNVISKDVLGIYSYSFSIASYFVLFSMLGIQKYGTRVISQVKDNQIKLRKTFWSLFTVHILISLVSTLAYVLMGFYIAIPLDVYIIQGLYVTSAIFDITWLFYGLENFKSVVIKNFIIKILEALAILFFINGNDDLILYTFIKSFSIFMGQAVMISTALKIVKPIKFSKFDMIFHIRPMLILSVSVLATSVYAILDKVLLGALSPFGNGDVALYEYADKIIKIPLSIIASIETVMLPRLSYLESNDREDVFIKMITKSVILISCVSVGASFGIASISKNFISLWYGQDYQYSAIVIILLSPIIIAISFGDIIRSQFLIPKRMDKSYTLTIIVGAVINLIINLVFIPVYGLSGAILGTVVSEFVICILQIYLVRKYLPIKEYCIKMLPYFIFGFFVLIVNKFITYYFGYGYGVLLLQLIFGGGIYCIISAIYINKIDNNLLKSILKKGRKLNR